MKKILFITAVLSISLWSCGGSGGEDTPPAPEPVNKIPSDPSNSKPVNDVLCIDNVVTFEWDASTDPDGDAVKYQLEVATDNQFSQNVQTKEDITTLTTQISLDRGVAYYWRVKAVDSKKASSGFSTAFQFYTEGDGELNHLPFLPSIVAPNMNEVVQANSVKLEWTASDTDDDPLKFDVYFGTNNPPTTTVIENTNETNVNVDLSDATNYFWKIVVKDDKGGSAIGQVWNFKTD